MADANIRAVITAKDEASRVVEGFTGSFGKMSAAVFTGQAALQGVENIFGAVVGVIGRAIGQAEQYELGVTRLQSGINNVKSATDKHIDSLLRQADALQQVTRFSDDQVISAQGILSTFQLNQDAISSLTPRLLDMSEGLAKVTGEMPDLEGNAILVAKAIGGEDTAGLSGALRRAGVVMTANQEEILKTGTRMERLSVITSVLDDNFQGMADAAGKTTAGQIAIMTHNIDDAEKKIGLALLPTISKLADQLSKFVQSEKFQHWLQQVSDWLSTKLPPFMERLTTQYLPAIGRAMQDAWPKIEAVASAFATVGKVIGEIGSLIVNVLAWVIGQVYNFIDTWNAFFALVRGTNKAIADAVSSVYHSVVNGFKDAGTWLYQAGRDIINGLVNGVKSIASAVGDAIKNIAHGAIDGAKSILGIHSPSSVFAEIGSNIGAGMIKGLNSSADGVQKAVDNLSPTQVNVGGSSGITSSITPFSSGSASTFNITVQAGVMTGTDSDMRKLSSMVVDAIKDVASSQGKTAVQLLA